MPSRSHLGTPSATGERSHLVHVPEVLHRSPRRGLWAPSPPARGPCRRHRGPQPWSRALPRPLPPPPWPTPPALRDPRAAGEPGVRPPLGRWRGPHSPRRAPRQPAGVRAPSSSDLLPLRRPPSRVLPRRPGRAVSQLAVPAPAPACAGAGRGRRRVSRDRAPKRRRRGLGQRPGRRTPTHGARSGPPGGPLYGRCCSK